MQPYGVRVIEYPDVGDIQEMGSKSSCGKFKEKGGDYKAYTRSAGKNRIRRAWKQKARRASKKLCIIELFED